jgi:hypothetical protein
VRVTERNAGGARGIWWSRRAWRRRKGAGGAWQAEGVIWSQRECGREEDREETTTCTGHDLDVFVFVCSCSCRAESVTEEEWREGDEKLEGFVWASRGGKEEGWMKVGRKVGNWPGFWNPFWEDGIFKRREGR